MRSGIYKITNEVTGKFYIGSSEDVDNRWEVGHKQALNRNQHCNPRLQHSWNFYGGDKFSLTLLEVVEPKKELLLEREQYYLDTFKPYIRGIGYNICPSAEGGDNITHHPNKAAFVEKMRWISMGENNPMFGRKHSKKSIVLQKQKAKGRYSIGWFVSRFGKEDGEKRFQLRRLMLANKPPSINIPSKKFGFSGKKHRSGFGVKQQTTRKYFVNNWKEFVRLVESKKYSQRQLSTMLGISRPTLKVKMDEIQSSKNA